MSAYGKLTLVLAMAALAGACALFGQQAPVDELALALTVSAVQTGNAGGAQAQPTLAASPVPAATATPGKCLAEATQNNINMRSGPDGDITGCCLADGEELEVLQFNDDLSWARVESMEVSAHRGWVDARFLDLYSDCGED